MSTARNARRYSPSEREKALTRAVEIGSAAAAKELGIPDGTIAGWRHSEKHSGKLKKVTPPAAEAPPATSPEPPAKPQSATVERRVAKVYTPSQRAQILEYAAVHGVAAAAKEFGSTRFTIYEWERRVALHAQGKCADSPVTGSDENPTAVRDLRILQEWKSSTGLGPSQVRNQLRRQGFKVSIHTVRCVLEENGYVTPKVRRESGHDQCYEAVRPDQLWHLDFLHRHINKQKIYVLILLDDFSRFIVGGAIWDGERVAAVQETFLASVNRYGKPEKALSDGGSAFYSWKGVGRFTDLLNELEIDQIIAKDPQTNGKLEVLNANIQKELFNQEKFFDLGETQRRLLAWIDFYNLRRTHHALGVCWFRPTATSVAPRRCWPASRPENRRAASESRRRSVSDSWICSESAATMAR